MYWYAINDVVTAGFNQLCHAQHQFAHQEVIQNVIYMLHTEYQSHKLIDCKFSEHFLYYMFSTVSKGLLPTHQQISAVHGSSLLSILPACDFRWFQLITDVNWIVQSHILCFLTVHVVVPDGVVINYVLHTSIGILFETLCGDLLLQNITISNSQHWILKRWNPSNQFLWLIWHNVVSFASDHIRIRSEDKS